MNTHTNRIHTQTNNIPAICFLSAAIPYAHKKKYEHTQTNTNTRTHAKNIPAICFLSAAIPSMNDGDNLLALPVAEYICPTGILFLALSGSTILDELSAASLICVFLL